MRDGKQNVVEIEEQQKPRYSKIMRSLQDQKTALEEEFAQCKNAEEKLIEVIKKEQEQLNALRLQMLGLQRAFAETTKLIASIEEDK